MKSQSRVSAVTLQKSSGACWRMGGPHGTKVIMARADSRNPTEPWYSSIVYKINYILKKLQHQHWQQELAVELSSGQDRTLLDETEDKCNDQMLPEVRRESMREGSHVLVHLFLYLKIMQTGPLVIIKPCFCILSNKNNFALHLVELHQRHVCNFL